MVTGQIAEGDFRSKLAGDPDLAEIVQMFVDEMPERVATLRRLWTANDWEGLARCAHQLKGAAGSYGFHQLTPYTTQLETAIRSESARDEAPALVEVLIEACGRVRAGVRPD